MAVEQLNAKTTVITNMPITVLRPRLAVPMTVAPLHSRLLSLLFSRRLKIFGPSAQPARLYTPVRNEETVNKDDSWEAARYYTSVGIFARSTLRTAESVSPSLPDSVPLLSSICSTESNNNDNDTERASVQGRRPRGDAARAADWRVSVK